MPSYLEEADKVAAVAAQHAVDVDKKGRYPQEAISALKNGGLAGLLISREMGGLGEGPRAAALIVERLAKECPSTAMVTTMHFSGSVVIDKYGSDDIRKSIAAGDHLTTLSLSRGRLAQLLLDPDKHGYRERGKRPPQCPEDADNWCIPCRFLCLVEPTDPGSRTQHPVVRPQRNAGHLGLKRI